MTDHPLRAQARLNEVDRQLQSREMRLAALHWFFIPSVAAALVSLVYFTVSHDVGFSTNMLGGAVGIAASMVVAVRGYRGLVDDRNELMEERESLVAALTGPDEEATPRLPDPVDP